MRDRAKIPIQVPKLRIIAMPTTPEKDDLEGVPEEIDQISAATSSTLSVTTLLQPSVAEVLQKLASFDVVHFACHGVSSHYNPLDRYLILQDEGFSESELVQDLLTVREIAKIDLKRARMAYLSACSTAENRSEENTTLT